MNIVTIEFNTPINSTSIYHNDVMIVESISGNCSLILETESTNKLSIHNDSSDSVYINNVAMFDLGKDRLVYEGMCHNRDHVYQSQDIPPGAIWVLEYSYPVFTWLYKTLNLGWLYQPD